LYNGTAELQIKVSFAASATFSANFGMQITCGILAKTDTLTYNSNNHMNILILSYTHTVIHKHTCACSICMAIL